MSGDDLDVLMPRAAVPVLVLDARIWKTHVPIVVRQLVLPCPAGDLFGLPIRPAVAVLLPSITLVEEPLIVTFELVVENDSANLSTITPEALVGALICLIDLGVVRQLTGLPDAGIEDL